MKHYFGFTQHFISELWLVDQAEQSSLSYFCVSMVKRKTRGRGRHRHHGTRYSLIKYTVHSSHHLDSSTSAIFDTAVNEPTVVLTASVIYNSHQLSIRD